MSGAEAAAAQRPVVCLGESLVDLLCEREAASLRDADEFRPHLGGALANVAVACRRAGAGAVLVSGAGDDPWGDWLRDSLDRHGNRDGLLRARPRGPDAGRVRELPARRGAAVPGLRRGDRRRDARRRGGPRRGARARRGARLRLQHAGQRGRARPHDAGARRRPGRRQAGALRPQPAPHTLGRPRRRDRPLPRADARCVRGPHQPRRGARDHRRAGPWAAAERL